eukprot:272824-Rhodomonas_salina.1
MKRGSLGSDESSCSSCNGIFNDLRSCCLGDRTSVIVMVDFVAYPPSLPSHLGDKAIPSSEEPPSESDGRSHGPGHDEETTSI